MRACNKVTTWGYILEMPGRMKRADQRKVLAALGVDMSASGSWWADKLDKAKRHRTAGQTQLDARNDLIRAAQHGDTVIVAEPQCLGVSAQDAAWFLEQMAEAGVTVVVNGDLVRVEPGNDASDLIAEVARRLNNFNAQKSRGRI
jgi:DNA invertase Pin-like site-specific DNA recombinase